MPDISLLNSTVLRGVVERFEAPQSLPLLSSVRRTPHPFPSVNWDILSGSRSIARPNVPNSEAHIVPRLGRGQGSASFIYLREKKVFEPTTLYWIRQPGAIAGANAEAAVLREVRDLNDRFDNFAELLLWKSLSGYMTVETSNSGPINVDYKFLPSHKPSPAVSWATATPQQIIADIRAWQRLVQRDSRVPATDVWTSGKTVDYIFDSFATTGATNFPGGQLLSDRMKDEYYSSGVLSGFMGLNWRINENVYDPDGTAYTANPTDPSAETLFVPDDSLILGNFTANSPMELFIGPTADDEAPNNYTGKFSKTWKEKDPSARQYLLEWNILPVITRPEQFVYVADVTI